MLKRIVATVLVLSMMLSLPGCYVDTDEIVDSIEEEISKEVDEAIDKAKEEASNIVDEAIDEVKADVTQAVNEIIDGIEEDGTPGIENVEDETDGTDEEDGSWLDDLLGRDMTITFHPNGGLGGPEKQHFQEDSHVLIVDKKPTKEGYHFVGWTRLEGENEPEFFAGEWTSRPFSQDTNLYACWENYDANDPFTVHASTGETLNFGGVLELIGGSAGVKNITIEHNYHLTKEKKGKVIRIHCDCGFELLDRDLSKNIFVAIKSEGENKTYDSLKESRKEKYDRDYILYRTQDFAPVAIALISSFYESFEAASQDFNFDKAELSSYYDSYNYDAAISKLGDFFDTLEDVSDFEDKIAKIEYSPEYVNLKFTYYDHNYKGQTIAQVLSQMRTEDISTPYREFANEYFGAISKGSNYASAAIGIGRAIFYGYNAFDPDESVTERTLSMVKAIHATVAFCPVIGDYYDEQFSALEEKLKLYDKCLKYQRNFYALLNEILKGTQEIEEINLSLVDVDQARNGNFDKAPSVMEVLGYLMITAEGMEQNNYSKLSKDQKTLVVWYLAMRLEYDFQQEYGIKLEDYKGYIK